MKNLSSMIFFLITCNQKVISRRLQNAIDDNLYFAKPYSISNGAAPPYQAWRHAEYDAYSDEHEHDHRIVFPDVDWSDAIPSWTAQRNIQQCVTSCQPNSAYQPVCGTNGVTYYNLEQMECFMRCGVDVNIRQMSPCPGWSGTTARPTQQPQTTVATPTSTFNIQQACMSSCPTTPEYNPVCGSDNVTYDNHGKLICAQLCGKDVQVLRRSPCPKKPPKVDEVDSTTPALQSTTPNTATYTSAAYQACKSSCPTTNEYNPVCGSDGVTYDNHGKLICAQICGKDVQEVRRSPCPKKKTTVELVSTNTTTRSTLSGSSNKVRRCMAHCPTDPQYDPVCGTNMETFYNLSRLQCAINCGVDGFKRPCRDTSPECLRRSLQAVLPEFMKGIPELGIPPLDPFKVENLNFVLPGGINVKLKEGYTKGLRKCHVDSVRIIGEDQYEVKVHCNVLTKGKYRSKGQFLRFPIDGEGDSKIKCRNLKVTCTFRLVPTTKPDGTQHMQILDFKSSHEYEGRVSFHLTNLFKGNPEISQAVLNFLNENWRLVSDKFGGPFFEYGIMGILNHVRKLLDIIPINQLEAI